MEKEEIKKEIENIKKAVDLIAHVLENIGSWGPIGTEKKVHDILYHKKD